MVLFGLAAEGITDQVTLENILCGYFENPDLEDEIKYLQPPFDKTDEKKNKAGGWGKLKKYLAHQRFHDDVLNCKYIIIQIDSDISPEMGIPHQNENSEIDIRLLIEEIIKHLISVIETAKSNFYLQNAEKIIFAVSVHSLECWLFAHYNNSNELCIHDCKKELKIRFPYLDKTREKYDKASAIYLEKINIENAIKKDVSFAVFIQRISMIKLDKHNSQ